uniref:MAPK regulated corepressor interacting protein 2-like n=1 Tax=Myxine glutinosa TaxID=7769 RepID=UPI00358F0158
MYTIARGPNKLVTHRLRGPCQQVDTKQLPLGGIDSLSASKRGDVQSGVIASISADPQCGSPKLVFNPVGERPKNGLHCKAHSSYETNTPQHDNNVRFVSNAWQNVERDLDNCSTSENLWTPVKYVEKTSSEHLKDFVAVDLDELWAERFMAKIKISS